MSQEDLIPPHADPPSAVDEAEVKQLFQMISYHAPLPPPAMLESYERILPGSAKRIFERMERQADHRQQMEGKELDAGVAAQTRGQIFGFVLGLVGMLGGFLLIWHGANIIGLSIFILTLASLVGVFIYGKKEQSKTLHEQIAQLMNMLTRGQSDTTEIEQSQRESR